MIRHFAIQYREWLYHKQDAENQGNDPSLGLVNPPGAGPIESSLVRLRASEHERDVAIMDLLKILRSFPLRVIGEHH